MAMSIEQMPAIEPGDLDAWLAACVTNGQPLVVLDRRMMPASGDEQFGNSLAEGGAGWLEIDLAAGKSWHALLQLLPDSLQRDLRFAARALAVWAGDLAAIDLPLPALGSGTCNHGCTVALLMRMLYGDVGLIPELVSEEELGSLRSMLRAAGESPRLMLDDPWFGRLFMAPAKEACLSLDRPAIWVDLWRPHVPDWVARRVATVVLLRALELRQHQDHSPELSCLVLGDWEFQPVVAALGRAEAIEEGCLWCYFSSGVQVGESEGRRPKGNSKGTADDEDTAYSPTKELYRMMPGHFDNRHYPAFVKGLMYGFQPFCCNLDTKVLSEELAFLAKDGLVPGMASPLVEFAESDWRKP